MLAPGASIRDEQKSRKVVHFHPRVIMLYASTQVPSFQCCLFHFNVAYFRFPQILDFRRKIHENCFSGFGPRSQWVRTFSFDHMRPHSPKNPRTHFWHSGSPSFPCNSMLKTTNCILMHQSSQSNPCLKFLFTVCTLFSPLPPLAIQC